MKKRIDAFLHEQALYMLPLLLGALVYGVIAVTVSTMPTTHAAAAAHR